MDDLRNKLAAELATVDWRALRTHLQRDNLILAAPELDLVEVAWCVASDRARDVAAWIAAGKVRKPGQEELTHWEREQEKPFRMLIVTPYILIQAI